MINLSIKYIEKGISPETGDILTLEHTKIIECVSIIPQPSMITAKDGSGKSYSFFYNTIKEMSIKDKVITKFNLDSIVNELIPEEEPVQEPTLAPPQQTYYAPKFIGE